jgi:hypothetical protein
MRVRRCAGPTVSHNGRANVCCVRRGHLRLRHQERRANLALEERRQPLSLLLRRAAPQQHLRHRAASHIIATTAATAMPPHDTRTHLHVARVRRGAVARLRREGTAAQNLAQRCVLSERQPLAAADVRQQTSGNRRRQRRWWRRQRRRTIVVVSTHRPHQQRTPGLLRARALRPPSTRRGSTTRAPCKRCAPQCHHTA